MFPPRAGGVGGGGGGPGGGAAEEEEGASAVAPPSPTFYCAQIIRSRIYRRRSVASQIGLRINPPGFFYDFKFYVFFTNTKPSKHVTNVDCEATKTFG